MYTALFLGPPRVGQLTFLNEKSTLSACLVFAETRQKYDHRHRGSYAERLPQ